jgi:endonuclease/exonuclease/phosphatase family metal-dependent hydrolase
MRLRIGTFNVENLVTRRLFEPANRGETEAALSLFHFPRPGEREAVERSVAVVLEDDKRQATALAIAEAAADIWLLQEVDSLASLQAFFANYVHRIADHRYGHFALMPGNDRRGIEIAFTMRRDLAEERDVRVSTHAEATFAELGVFDETLAAMGRKKHDRVFQRDCLEVALDFRGRSLTVFGCHLKSMSNGRDDGREATLPLRRAEARAVKRIIKERFGPDWREANWIVAGDLNGYRSSLGPGAEVVDEGPSGIEPLTDDFAADIWNAAPPHQRWTHFRRYWSEGEGRLLERHMPLDHILISPALAAANPHPKVETVRRGLPYRVPLDPAAPDRSIAHLATTGDRYPRIGWDRPKASDHSPLVVELDLP